MKDKVTRELLLHAPGRFWEAADALVKRTDAKNIGVLLGWSLALYELVFEHVHEKGAKLILRYPDGDIEVAQLRPTRASDLKPGT